MVQRSQVGWAVGDWSGVAGAEVYPAGGGHPVGTLLPTWKMTPAFLYLPSQKARGCP